MPHGSAPYLHAHIPQSSAVVSDPGLWMPAMALHDGGWWNTGKRTGRDPVGHTMQLAHAVSVNKTYTLLTARSQVCTAVLDSNASMWTPTSEDTWLGARMHGMVGGWGRGERLTQAAGATQHCTYHLLSQVTPSGADHDCVCASQPAGSALRWCPGTHRAAVVASICRCTVRLSATVSDRVEREPGGLQRHPGSMGGDAVRT